MKGITGEPLALGALLVGAGLLVAVWAKKKPGESFATAAGTAAAGAVADAGAGVVLGIGDVVGIPRTEQTQCERDLAAGSLWDASFSCPAGTFITQGLFGSTPAPAPAPAYTGGASGGW